MSLFIIYSMVVQARTAIGLGTVAALLLCAGCGNRATHDRPEAENAWKILPPLPIGNGGFVAGIKDDQLLIIGGTTWLDGEKHWLDDVGSFSIGSLKWRAAEPLSTPIAYAAFGSNDHGIYWLGGSDGINTLDDFYHATAASSIHRVSSTGHRVVYAGAAVDDEALYVVGGAEDVSDLSTLSDRFLRVTLETGEVNSLPPYPGGAVMLPAVVYTDREILVFGGARYDTATSQVVNVTDAYAYSLQHATWRKLAPIPYARRGMAACWLKEGTIFLGGGYGSEEDHSEESFVDDAMIYHLSADRYLPATDLPYAAMGQALVNNRGTLYLAGGEDRPRQRSSALYVYRVSRE